MNYLKINVATWCQDQHRQIRTDQTPFVLGEQPDEVKIVVELMEDQEALVTPRVRVQNLGTTCELTWHSQLLELGEVAEVTLPLHVVQEGKHLEIRQHGQLTAFNRPFHTIERPRNSWGEPLVPIDRLGVAPSAELLSRWFAALELLQHSSAGSADFFNAVTRATTNPGGMTAGFVILRVDNEWQTMASHLPDPMLGIGFCYDVLDKVVADGRTHFHDAEENSDELPAGADSVVAAPIFDKENVVIGAVYGYRSMRSRNKRRSIRPLEAVWIQLLAGAVGAGLSRFEAEAEAARTSVLLEQAFSPKVIREIVNNPAALTGQERETTILFADLRESSRISEQLPPQDNYELLSQVLDMLSLQVRENDGVIIDYYGDGMAAMWNAPADQPEHARLGCQAAIAMQQGLVELNKKWELRLGRPVQVGIGINTGLSRVGNAGSTTRLKYGPRGTVVNIASRMESATKHLGLPILLTASTAGEIKAKACVRRVGRVRLAGIHEPVEAYQLCSMARDSVSDEILRRIEQYEVALQALEQGDLDRAERLFRAYSDSPMAAQLPAQFMLQAIASNRLELTDPALLDVIDLTST